MNRWLPVLLVAGCSTMQWDKPGATSESTSADWQACSRLARSVPTAPAARTTTGEVRAGPAGVSLSEPPYNDADRQLQQGQRVEDCMRAKGYSLKRSS